MTAVPLVDAATSNRARRVSIRRSDPVLLVSAGVCVLLTLVAIFGALLAPYAPDQTDILAASQGPSGAHWLGTDALGRDILSRLLYGARLSFLAPGLIVVLCISVGTGLGILAAWWEGWVDSLLSKVFNVVFAVPGILVAIVAAAVFGAGFWAPVLALSLVYTPYVARIVRTSALVESHMPYIEACQVANFSSWRICSRHILRNVSPVVLSQAAIAFGSALMDFGAIGFLGFGVQAPQAEWGLMVSQGQAELLQGQAMQSLAAGLMIVISVVAFNVLGERLTTKSEGRR